jgi:hypothetical protein
MGEHRIDHNQGATMTTTKSQAAGERIVHHPVFPGRQGPAARRIEDEDDVRDVIELLRLNYDRMRS